jgi:hypothetical protein
MTNIFKWLHCNNLQVNTKKSSFCTLETKYLGFLTYQRRYQTATTKGQCDPSSCLLPQPSLALLLPLLGWLFAWQWDRICLRQISRTSSIIWNLIQIDHCQKPSSQWYPGTHPSSNRKSPMFQLPHHSRPRHHICPTRTPHASYVGH